MDGVTILYKWHPIERMLALALKAGNITMKEFEQAKEIAIHLYPDRPCFELPYGQ